MEKNVNILIVLFVLIFSSTLNAQTIYGVCTYSNTTLKNLTCFGPATLVGTKVTGKLSVYGPLTLDDAYVNKVTVKGMIRSKNSKIHGVTSVYGPIFADKTKFFSDVFSATTVLQLVKSTVKGKLTIESKDKHPILYMACNSVIKKGVVFSNLSGLIKISNNSNIRGKIDNGTKQKWSKEAIKCGE